MHQLKSLLSTQRGAGKVCENAHNRCEKHIPIEVEFDLVNRVIVTRNNGSSDSPSVLMIPTTFRGSERGMAVWTAKSDRMGPPVSLSMRDTGTPEFVNRIYIPWLVRVKGK